MSPGLTPRPSLSGTQALGAAWLSCDVSPGLTPRPSLSGLPRGAGHALPGRVAGVDSPAFVERRAPSTATSRARAVSPGLTPRPSLSVLKVDGIRRRLVVVSPGLTPRPSLSAPEPAQESGSAEGVAGVDSPAFVERLSTVGSSWLTHRVAGVDSPAFVERDRPSTGRVPARRCRRG